MKNSRDVRYYFASSTYTARMPEYSKERLGTAIGCAFVPGRSGENKQHAQARGSVLERSYAYPNQYDENRLSLPFCSWFTELDWQNGTVQVVSFTGHVRHLCRTVQLEVMATIIPGGAQYRMYIHADIVAALLASGKDFTKVRFRWEAPSGQMRLVPVEETP